MIKKISITAFILIFILLNIFGAKGSGVYITEERKLDKFHSVEIKCNAKVVIKKTSGFNAVIKADDNAMSSIKTEVKRGVLEIDLKGIFKDVKIEINISMGTIKALSVSGLGSIVVEDNITSDNLELRVTGQGYIVANTGSKFVFSKVFGKGYIDIRGKTAVHEIELSGGGLIKGLDLEASECKIKVSEGEGTCKIYVVNKLDIKVGGLGGNGIIEYKGNPELDVKILGSANITTLK